MTPRSVIAWPSTRAPRSSTAGLSRASIACRSGSFVNNSGERFYDEGEDLWPKRYAIWGRLVAQQPDQIAWSIIDGKSAGRFMPSVFLPVEAGTIEELAGKLELPVARVAATVRSFNAAVLPGAFDHTLLDGCRTQGLNPEKTNWAQRLDTPPFRAYPLASRDHLYVSGREGRRTRRGPHE